MKFAAATLLLLTLLTLFGCGETTSVTGTVEYNGTPVENGYFSLTPAEKGRSFAAPIKNGVYEIAEAEPGSYTATAIGTKKVNHYASSAEAYANASKRGGHMSEAADYIPAKAEGNSETVEIQPGDQTVNLTITGPPVKK